jgi:tRNA (adenine57-N1/adenine58-N1)-methyltransferase
MSTPPFFFPGTGSGSFTHSIARTVGATGHVYSYEFHEARASTAAWVPPLISDHRIRTLTFTSIHYLHVSSEEFARHGMSDIVTLTHRNVCKNGFTVTDTADSGTPLSLNVSPLTVRKPIIRQSSWTYLRLGKRSNTQKLPYEFVFSLTSLSLFHRICSQKDRLTRICCFSPCIEQVLRTVSALNEAGFTGTSTKFSICP